MRYRFALSLSSLCAVGLAAVVFSFSHAQVDHPASKLQQPTSSGESTGRHVFMAARCFACHGEYGFGGVGPRFRENRFVGLADYVVGQILVGRGIMPSFADALSDQQIAEVASYIRNSWGNQFGPVKPEEVAKVRRQIRLHPVQNRPHLPPESQQPPGAPMPPQTSLPPGEAQPPENP
jgi:mono/diheme cytochrome c family protein